MEQTGKTVLQLLLEQHPATPRSRAKQWIENGRVRVGGAVVRRLNSLIEDPGAVVELLGRREVALSFKSEWRIHSKLAVLYLDSSLAVVDKAAGLLAVPLPGTGMSAMSVLGGVMASGGGERELPPSFKNLRPLPVHRLDQYTTGVLCMALNPTARAHLIDQFSKHTATREYIAYVDGAPKLERGTWRHLLRFDEERLRQQVVGTGRDRAQRAGTVEAITHYEVVEEFPVGDGRLVSKLRLKLETGRTHQIRVQAAKEGMPLLGDRLYHPQYQSPYRSGRDDLRSRLGRGGKPAAEKVPLERPIVECDRQALHAETLELEHPEHPGKRMKWRAPLPEDLQKLEDQLHHMARRARWQEAHNTKAPPAKQSQPRDKRH